MDIEAPVINGTEGSSPYTASSVRLCLAPQPGGGAPQQDPKQPSQMHQPAIQGFSGAMPLSYPGSGTRPQNCYPSTQRIQGPRGMNAGSARAAHLGPPMPQQQYHLVNHPQLYPQSPGVLVNNMTVPVFSHPLVSLPQGSGRHPNPAGNPAASQPFFIPGSIIVGPAYNPTPNSYMQIPQQQVPQMRSSVYQSGNAPPNAPPTQTPPQQQQQQQVMTQQMAPPQSGVIPPTPGVALVNPGLMSSDTKNKKRINAIKIIDPNTGKDVLEEMKKEESSIQSGESSSSNTPQPQVSADSSHMAAMFALKVASAAASPDDVIELSNGPALQEIDNSLSSNELTKLKPPASVPGKHNLDYGKSDIVVSGKEETPVVSAKTNSPSIDVHHHRIQMGGPKPLTLRSSAPTSAVTRAVITPPINDNSNFQKQQVKKPPAHQQQQPAPHTIEKKDEKRYAALGNASSQVQPAATGPAPPRKEESSPPPTTPQIPPQLAQIVSSTVSSSQPSSIDSSSKVPPAKQASPPAPEPSVKNVSSPTPPTPSPEAETEFPSPIATQPPSSAPTTLSSCTVIAQNVPSPSTQGSSVEEKQSNGEATEQSLDGKSGMRKKKSSKLLNRKGNEKESSSELDAYVEISGVNDKSVTSGSTTPANTSAYEVEDTRVPSMESELVKERISPSPQKAAVEPVSEGQVISSESEAERKSPPRSPSPPALCDNDGDLKSFDYKQIDGKDSEKGSSEDLVNAKNDENSKIDSSVNSSDSQQTEIIDKSISALKYPYAEGQWSPLNRDGKKQYDREFLMTLQKHPLSSKKPETLPTEITRDKDKESSNGRRQYNHSSLSCGGGGGGNSASFMPNFQQTRGSLSSNTRPGVKTRNSQNRAITRSSKQYPSQTKADTKYVPSENAWRPDTLIDPTLPEKDRATKVLYKKVTGILNRLTPEKFDTLHKQLISLPIDSREKLDGVMELILKKAVDEPGFSTCYAELCEHLRMMEVKQEKIEDPDKKIEADKKINFRKILLTRCQNEFEKIKEAESLVEKKHFKIDEETDLEKRKELQLLYEEDERKMRRRSVGLVRFIGELFKRQMLTANIMHRCVQQLLSKIDEESLECLCKLLMTIGKDLEENSKSQQRENEWNSYFRTMGALSQKGGENKLSSRVRFMLQDVIDLKERNWVPRMLQNNPKTIEQIQRDAERETIDSSTMYLGNMAQQNRKHEERKRVPKTSDDGWTNVGGKSFRGTHSSFHQEYKPQPNKLAHIRSADSDSSSILSPSNPFLNWGSGSSFKHPQTNQYAPLAQDDKKSINSSRSKTPSASIEKDRAMQGMNTIMEKRNIGQNSGPPSRDSSRPRYTGSSGSASSAPRPPVQSAPTPRQEDKELDDDKVKSNIKTVIGELQRDDITEAVQYTRELFLGPVNLQKFVLEIINMSFDLTETLRKNIGELLSQLLAEKHIETSAVVTGFENILEILPDLKIDYPKIDVYMNDLLVPVLSSGAITFGHLKEMSAVHDVSSVLVEVLKQLIKSKGPVWIRSQWEASKVELKDFVPENRIDEFIATNKCSYLFGDVEVCAETSLTDEEIENKILEFLKSGQDTVTDHIFDWVKANVGDQIRKPSFIRAITRAIVGASTSGDKLNRTVFDANDNLLRCYIDHDDNLELTCLYTIQDLVVNVRLAPSGLLQSIFQALCDNSTISSDAFLKYQQRDAEETPAEKQGKGVALKTLSTFFKSLFDPSEDAEDDPTS